MSVIKRLPEVIKQVGYSRSSLYAKVKTGDFPAPILLGRRAVGWLSTDIDEWIAGRVEASRGTNTTEASINKREEDSGCTHVPFSHTVCLGAVRCLSPNINQTTESHTAVSGKQEWDVEYG